MTISESLFERYCADLGVACKRMTENTARTPDYELIIEAQKIIVEVKEFSRNKEERESDRLLAERGYGSVLSGVPGDRVRKKINVCSAQMKARTNDIYPSMLILFDRGLLFGHLDPYHIRVAMYGLEQIHMTVPADPSVRPYATGTSFGPKRKMTELDNNSISAIGVLATPDPGRIALYVYHNKYALVPLKPALLAKYASDQYELETEVPGRTASWRKCDA